MGVFKIKIKLDKFVKDVYGKDIQNEDDEFKEYITKKIDKDFKYTNKFYEENKYDNLGVKGKFDIRKIDIDENVIEFAGINVVDKLASIIITIINSHGIFRYNTLEDFYYSTDGRDKEGRVDSVKSHMHWFSYFNDIYGKDHKVFKAEEYKQK